MIGCAEAIVPADASEGTVAYCCNVLLGRAGECATGGDRLAEKSGKHGEGLWHGYSNYGRNAECDKDPVRNADESRRRLLAGLDTDMTEVQRAQEQETKARPEEPDRVCGPTGVRKE